MCWEAGERLRRGLMLPLGAAQDHLHGLLQTGQAELPPVPA